MNILKIYKLLCLILLVTLAGCTKNRESNLPKEGEVVTWKQTDELIVKATLGARREHIVDTHCKRCERDFYRPELENYLGQFPLGYRPEKFDKISLEEAKALKYSDAVRALEFYLTLNGKNIKATDQYSIDDIDQIRVRVERLSIDLRKKNMTTQKLFIDSEDEKYVKLDSKFRKYDLDCYINSYADNHFLCYGKSKNGGVLLKAIQNDVSSFRSLQGDNYEYGKYGGIRITWQTDVKNLEKWQEIDEEIWRLLEIWNVSPN